MTYQRSINGLYWTNGFQEADDSPRNALMHYAVSATSYQALAALYLGASQGRSAAMIWHPSSTTNTGNSVNW